MYLNNELMSKNTSVWVLNRPIVFVGVASYRNPDTTKKKAKKIGKRKRQYVNSSVDDISLVDSVTSVVSDTVDAKKTGKRKRQNVNSSAGDSSRTDSVSSVVNDTVAAKKTGKRKRQNVNSSVGDAAIQMSVNDTPVVHVEHGRKKTKRKWLHLDSEISAVILI